MHTSLRPRRDEDAAQCVRLLEHVHQTDGYPVHWPEHPARWLSPRGTVCAWVVEMDGTIVGHVVLHTVAADHADWEAATRLPTRDLAVIGRLFVGEDHRGAGIGGALLDAASTEARARGLQPVLDVVETRINALGLYERRGFRRVLTKPWSDGTELSHHFYVARTTTPRP